MKLLKYAENLQVDLDVLKSAIKVNNKIRSAYDSLDEREKQQNISYNEQE